jgi:hypothetical protein
MNYLDNFGMNHPKPGTMIRDATIRNRQSATCADNRSPSLEIRICTARVLVVGLAEKFYVRPAVVSVRGYFVDSIRKYEQIGIIWVSCGAQIICLCGGLLNIFGLEEWMQT